MAFFPRQDIPQVEKTEKWALLHRDYAKELLELKKNSIDKKTRLYQAYNGETVSSSVRYLTQTYGKKNRTKYVDYRLGKPKIDMLNNEFLQRPLYSTISTINIDAKTAKLDNYEMMLGAAHAKKEIEKLKTEAGVDPLNGAPIPDLEDESTWNIMNFKEKNERLMQTLTDTAIKEDKLKLKLAKNFQDIKIVSECFGKIDVDENGDETYIRIDPRYAIYEEIDEDYFLEKTPVIGAEQIVPVHNILMRYRLKKEQRDELDGIRKNNNQDNRPGFLNHNGNVCASVIHIEWKTNTPMYFKISPKTKKQLEFDDSDDSYRIELNTDEYEKNRTRYDKDVESGKYKIEVKWRADIYEATFIGNDIVVNFGPKKFLTRSVDKPGDVLGYSYCGALFNTVNGLRISLQEVIENFNSAFNVVMFQTLKEVNKAKGKVLGYNRAAMPKNKTIQQVMYDALNDSFVDYDTSSSGNWSGKDLDITNMFKEIDLGMSASFPQLVMLKRELMATVDRLTGINENREGQIKASSTASNAQSSIEASRTITEGMFYFMNLYVEKVLLKYVETMKVTWGLYKTEKAKIILGDDMFNFMEVTRLIYNADYAVNLVDGGKEIQIRNYMQGLAESSLNSKELRYKDVLAYQLTDTLTDGKKVLEKAWAEMEAIRQKDSQAQMQANAEQTDKTLNAQIEMAREDREDRQEADVNKIIVKGDTDIRVNAAKGKGQMILDQNKIDNENLQFE
jgi:hypothetical protein